MCFRSGEGRQVGSNSSVVLSSISSVCSESFVVSSSISSISSKETTSPVLQSRTEESPVADITLVSELKATFIVEELRSFDVGVSNSEGLSAQDSNWDCIVGCTCTSESSLFELDAFRRSSDKEFAVQEMKTEVVGFSAVVSTLACLLEEI